MLQRTTTRVLKINQQYARTLTISLIVYAALGIVYKTPVNYKTTGCNFIHTRRFFFPNSIASG